MFNDTNFMLFKSFKVDNISLFVMDCGPILYANSLVKVNYMIIRNTKLVLNNYIQLGVHRILQFPAVGLVLGVSVPCI